MMLSRLTRTRLVAGMLVVAVGGVGGCKKPCSEEKKDLASCEGSSTTYTKVACPLPPESPNRRAELDHRRWRAWSRITAVHDVDPGPPPPDPSDPTLDQLPTNQLVEELQVEEGRDQELFQACDAPEAIRRHIGGIAVIMDKDKLQMPPEGVAVVELPSEIVKHSESLKDICPSETAGDTLRLDTDNSGTLFFLDRHHLVGAGHLIEDCNYTTDRLTKSVIVFGLTHRAITDRETIEVPVEQVIDGSTVTVEECHNDLNKEGDWVVLRTDACICSAEPLPVRWNDPAVETEVVHTLGHPNYLTMKYGQPSKVGRSRPEVPIFEMDLVTDGGSSGGPVFDDAGNVVGINNGNYKDRCSLKCTSEAGTCCRLAPCKLDNCLLDGYATHIGRVEAAWKNSNEKVSWEECEKE